MSQPLASFQIGSSFQDLLNTVFHSIPKVLVFLFVLVIGWFVATASVVLFALGVNAALHQVGFATTVTQPVLYAVLLTCGGIVAIGVGGGLVKPMQARWERMLTAAESETSSQLAAYQQGRADALRAAQAQGQGQVQSQAKRDDQPSVQRQGEPPAASPGYSAGPRYLQMHSHGSSRGPGYLAAPVFSTSPGQSQEPDFQDDPENYPGGQYM